MDDDRLITQRKQKLISFANDGVNPYASKFNKRDYAQEILNSNRKLKKDQRSKSKVSIAGRVITLRIMGRAGFAHILDSSGKIQIYAREEELGSKEYKIFSKLDLGDIVGIDGVVFRTKKGEISVWVKNFELLTKNLRPLPEKWHGLKDTELRYRQRYVDLIVNPDVKEVFLLRNKIINFMREFLVKEGFIEVETPILQPIYGGTSAKPFKSYLNNLGMDVYLRISNELYLKRLIVGGYEKIFEFSTDFRNEGIDTTHNPEFLQMETMWAYANYKDNMEFAEKMIKFIARKIGKTRVEYAGNRLDIGKKWLKLSMLDALKRYAKIDVEKITDFADLLRKNKIEFEGDIGWGPAVNLLFEELVEKKLVQPTIIYDYPVETSPLAKIGKDKRFAERFEIYINGWEIGNSYSELNDPSVLRKNWENQEIRAKRGDEEAQRMDSDFLNALEIGMPPTSGFGIGIDRLVMILTGSHSIKDVIFFPFMKPVLGKSL